MATSRAHATGKLPLRPHHLRARSFVRRTRRGAPARGTLPRGARRVRRDQVPPGARVGGGRARGARARRRRAWLADLAPRPLRAAAPGAGLPRREPERLKRSPLALIASRAIRPPAR